MKGNPFFSEHMVRGIGIIPTGDSSIKRWLADHEEIEDELGIISPQEDVPPSHEVEDEEEELIYHFR